MNTHFRAASGLVPSSTSGASPGRCNEIQTNIQEAQ
jgi:hypothetical protein